MLLIPQKPPTIRGLDMAFVYDPAIQVGGDVFDLMSLTEERLLVFVGDAMGHGVQAAMMMAATKMSLRAVLTTGDPARVLRLMNGELCGLISDRFVTAVCTRVDPKTGQAEVALAGHIPPYHFDGRTGNVARPGDGSLPLGVKATEDYPSVQCAIGPGDALVFCTDGITEAVDPQGVMYGDDRLAEQVRQHGKETAAEMIRLIVADLQAFCQETLHKDDVTLVAVKVLAEPAAS